MVSVIDLGKTMFVEDDIWTGFVNRFYCVSLKRDATGKIRYGQQHYDYGKGVLSFTAPNQVHQMDLNETGCTSIKSGYLLVFHVDFLLGHALANDIKQYGFFSYAVNEALHLSEAEETDLISILQKIDQECAHIDRHTQEIILSQIDLLLNYSNRFYERQFITRKNNNHQLLVKFETFLERHYQTAKSGLLTVQHLAEYMNLSPNYLSDLFRVHTGQNTQQHIHEKLIEKAKEKLSTTDLSVSEIAYTLGFEHAQSFSTLFRKKTSMSPLAFRQSFN